MAGYIHLCVILDNTYKNDYGNDTDNKKNNDNDGDDDNDANEYRNDYDNTLLVCTTFRIMFVVSCILMYFPYKKNYD